MKKLTRIGYIIFNPDSSIKKDGCIRKPFRQAFRRIKYLIKRHGKLIKFTRHEKSSL